MDHDQRRSAVIALTALAAGHDYRDRADAGRALAGFADMAESRETLARLLLDADNTFVTLVTAEALLRRQDTAGLALVAAALVSADVQRHTYIDQAVTAVFMVFASERDQALEACDALLLDTDPRVREGTAELRELLAQLQPVLYPQ